MKKSIIKTFLSLIFTVIFITSCNQPSGRTDSVEQTDRILFTENFDKTALNGIPDTWIKDFWTSDSTDDIYIGVVDAGTAPVSGPNCLKLWDFSSTASAGVNRVIGNQNYGQLKFDVYPDSSAEFRQATLFISNSNNNKIEFNINRSGTISIKDQSGVRTNVGSCTLDSWHTVEAMWDRITGYYRFFLDSADCGAYPMADSEIPNKIRIRSGNTDDPLQNSSIIYIDNVVFSINRITLGPVPITGFYENFESTSAGSIPGSWALGYSSDGSGCSAKVVDTATIMPYEGIHCLELIDKSSANAASIQKNINKKNTGQMKFSVNVKSGAKSSGAFFLYDTGENFMIQLYISMYNSIKIRTPDGTDAIVSSPYPYNTWFTIEVRWDTSSGYCQVLINDVSRGFYKLTGTGTPAKIKFRSGNVSDASQNDSTIYLDSIIYNIDNVPVNP